MINMNKQELYDLIYNLTFKTEKYAVGFHLCGNLDVNNGIEKFKAATGREPALIDFDMHSLPFFTASDICKAINELHDFTKKGGFIALTAHWLTPTVNIKDAECRGANNCRDHLTKEEFTQIYTDGTYLNANFNDELDLDALFIKKLESLGIPVIFRPMHEINGGWFWWQKNYDYGITGEHVAKLFRYVHNYFESKWGLKNILWEYNASLMFAKEEAAKAYPGNEYIDILSLDWYLKEGSYTDFYFELQKAAGKEMPFALAEFGGDGNYHMDEFSLRETQDHLERHFKNGAKCAYLGFYFEFPQNIDKTLSDYSVTLEELGDYKV